MRKIEILAPAGGEEQLIAAVRSGADAVYLGLNKFNARANAHNFSDANKVVAYCHARGVKVHFVLNTLIKDKEIDSLISTIKEVAASGADAVIVQDFATAYLVKLIAPSLPMHASTQMTVHNLDGVKFLESYGFQRVVLARELSLKEIEYICKNSNIEIEVFIHGALCMCTSGACYMSSILGGRSGNRGYCAQPCRLDFKCNDKRYALSLKDMSSINYINDLINAGVCSLKIEGRMKRPEYVSASVKSCFDKINGFEPDIDTLKSVFSRSGFTDGYLTSRINGKMFGHRQKEDVLSSESVYKKIRANYQKEFSRVNVDFKIEIKKNLPSKLLAFCEGRTIVVQGNIPEVASSVQVDNDTVGIQLRKSGGTQFVIKKIDFDIDNGLYLSKEDLNSLRRNALIKLDSLLSEIKPHKIYDYKGYSINNSKCPSNPAVYVRCESFQQAMAVKNAKRIILPVDEILNHPDAVDVFGTRLFAAAPQLKWNDKIDYLSSVKSLGVSNIIADNIWTIYKCNELGLNVYGGHGLNIFNSISANEYAKFGIKDMILSFELSMNDIINIKSEIPKGIIAYGKLPLMQVRSCPARYDDGCRGCNGKPVLKDRYENCFPIICHNKLYSTILNPIPLDLRGKKIENLDFILLWFTDEDSNECERIFDSYNGSIIEKQEPVSNYTRGLYYKNVL